MIKYKLKGWKEKTLFTLQFVTNDSNKKLFEREEDRDLYISQFSNGRGMYTGEIKMLIPDIEYDNIILNEEGVKISVEKKERDKKYE